MTNAGDSSTPLRSGRNDGGEGDCSREIPWFDDAHHKPLGCAPTKRAQSLSES